MKLRKFQAATMREAIAEVKAALGPDAMIVATRDVRRGLLGMGIEVTAAVDEDEERTAEPAAPPPPAPAAPPPAFALTEGDVERIMAPLRSELRALRAQLRPTDDPAPKRLESELAEMRRTLQALRTLVPGTQPEVTRELLAARAKTATIAAPAVRRILALIGPTGVGKTTTIAKIAAREALIALRSVAIVSLDTYRVGGQEQIRIFADLIGVPLAVVSRIEELPATVARFAGYDRILIDTAGRSPRDQAAITQLVQGLLQLENIEIHLALPAGSDAGAVDTWIERYGAINIDRLLFTKVDEASRLTELVEAPARNGKPVSWVTTGQRVPEDIEDATAERLLSLAAGGFTTAEEEAA